MEAIRVSIISFLALLLLTISGGCSDGGMATVEETTEIAVQAVIEGDGKQLSKIIKDDYNTAEEILQEANVWGVVDSGLSIEDFEIVSDENQGVGQSTMDDKKFSIMVDTFFQDEKYYVKDIRHGVGWYTDTKTSDDSEE